VKLSVCGLDCSECDFHQTLCAGCREVEGKPFWIEIGCELFSCSLEKNFNNSGDCLELPCEMFIELKDPNISDEEHLKEIENRVNRLKRIN